MGRLLELKNGEKRPVMTIDDAIEIVADFAGDEVAEYMKEEIAQLKNELHEALQMADINESRCEEYATIVFQNQNALDLAIERLKQVKTELEKAKSQCEEY